MARPKSLRPLSDAELDTLKVLWQTGPHTAGAVRDRLNAGGREWAYTTTKTILDRLEEKGYVRRRRGATPHVYVPVVSADSVARAGVSRLRRDIFDGAGLPMIRALVEGSDLTADELSELRELLARLESGAEEEQ